MPPETAVQRRWQNQDPRSKDIARVDDAEAPKRLLLPMGDIAMPYVCDGKGSNSIKYLGDMLASKSLR